MRKTAHDLKFGRWFDRQHPFEHKTGRSLAIVGDRGIQASVGIEALSNPTLLSRFRLGSCIHGLPRYLLPSLDASFVLLGRSDYCENSADSVASGLVVNLTPIAYRLPNGSP